MSENDRLLRAIASALWNIGQGYTVEDVRAVGGDPSNVGWHPENEDDRRDEALHLSHAQAVLDFLLTEGWTPPAGVQRPGSETQP